VDGIPIKDSGAQGRVRHEMKLRAIRAGEVLELRSEIDAEL